jgi:hypothetical protein
MNNCTRCGRKLKNASPTGMGPRCTLFVLGAKPKRVAREDRRSADERQQELALEARA